MRTETIEIYTFDELSDSAKEKARGWWRNGDLDYDWYEPVYSDFVEICGILGFDVDSRDIQFSAFVRKV